MGPGPATTAGSQCVAVCPLCTAHVVLRLMKLCRTREVTPLLQLPGLGWVLTADVVTNVPGQQLCQGTGGGSDVVRAKHATLHRHYVASSLHAHTGTMAMATGALTSQIEIMQGYRNTKWHIMIHEHDFLCTSLMAMAVVTALCTGTVGSTSHFPWPSTSQLFACYVDCLNDLVAP